MSGSWRLMCSLRPIILVNDCEHILHCGATQFLMIWPSMCFLLWIFKWVLSWNFQLQILHYSFGSECINSCLFIEPFCVNACKHDLHVYAFSPLCTFLCDFNRFSPLNIRGHWSHFRVFSRCETLWPFRLTSVLNALPHRSHLNFFTLECKALCLCNVPWLAYFFGHSLHLKGLSSASNFFLSHSRLFIFFRSFLECSRWIWLMCVLLFSIIWFNHNWQIFI